MVAQVDLSGSKLVFGIATRSLVGTFNGDAYLIKTWDSHVLIALIDGLGHGEEAAAASSVARNFVDERFTLDIKEIISGLHERLRRTRGAAVGLLRIDQAEKKFAFCGVGNIEVRVLSEPSMHPLSVEGVVGMNRIRIKKFEYSYNSLKAIILYSDGISSNFDFPGSISLVDPQKTADSILSQWRSEWDDATIIVATEKTTYG